MLKLLIAEDLDLVAEAFVALLNTEPEFEVVARVNRGDRVVEAAREHRPDIALLDVVMPGLTGIEACRQLRQALPDCKVMLLTSIPRSGHLATALAAGSSAYLPKTSTAEQLVEAIHTVAGGGVVLDPAIAAEALVAGPTRSPTGSATRFAWCTKGCEPRRSPRSCSCPAAPSATTCPVR